MREKPAYQALYQLIKREWNTQARVTSDERGQAAFRGFYGTYDVTATAGDKAQTFELALTRDAPKVHQLKMK